MSDWRGIKSKCVVFSGRWGTQEDQLNKILKVQDFGTEVVKRFLIKEVKPVFDNGHYYFWIFYYGEFPDKKVWENTDK